MSQTRQGIVECPRCHKIWYLDWGSAGVECTCHLFCSGGTKPSDCSVTYPYNLSNQQLGYPTGLHNDAANEGDNIYQRGGYCATHSRYTKKEPLLLELDWKTFEKQRLNKKYRLVK